MSLISLFSFFLLFLLVLSAFLLSFFNHPFKAPSYRESSFLLLFVTTFFPIFSSFKILFGIHSYREFKSIWFLPVFYILDFDLSIFISSPRLRSILHFSYIYYLNSFPVFLSFQLIPLRFLLIDSPNQSIFFIIRSCLVTLSYWFGHILFIYFLLFLLSVSSSSICYANSFSVFLSF